MTPLHSCTNDHQLSRCIARGAKSSLPGDRDILCALATEPTPAALPALTKSNKQSGQLQPESRLAELTSHRFAWSRSRGRSRSRSHCPSSKLDDRRAEPFTVSNIYLAHKPPPFLLTPPPPFNSGTN